jgi:hypothetical protein
MSKRVIPPLLILRMEQLKVGTNDLPSVTKKKVAATAASVLSTEAFPMAELALQLEVPCHTPFQERGNEASIRVPRMFKSHV